MRPVYDADTDADARGITLPLRGLLSPAYILISCLKLFYNTISYDADTIQ